MVLEDDIRGMVLNNIFNFQTKTISRSALVLGISYFLSALLALFRDRLLAGRFGAGPELDVYFAAFRIPDFVYNLLILGGFAAAFLPLFSEYFSRNKEEAWEATNHLLNAFLFFLVAISLVIFIFTPWLVRLLFPGFGPQEQALAIPLVRLLFLSPIIFGISNLLSGILHYFNRFLVFGLTPILYNLGIIFGILFLSPAFGIFGVGMGVVLGAFLHMAIQIPSARNCGFSYKPVFNLRHPALRRIFSLMMPRIFAVAAQQINLIVIVAIASTIAAGSIAIFNFFQQPAEPGRGHGRRFFCRGGLSRLVSALVPESKKRISRKFLSRFPQDPFFDRSSVPFPFLLKNADYIFNLQDREVRLGGYTADLCLPGIVQPFDLRAVFNPSFCAGILFLPGHQDSHPDYGFFGRA